MGEGGSNREPSCLLNSEDESVGGAEWDVAAHARGAGGCGAQDRREAWRREERGKTADGGILAASIRA